MGLQVAAGHAAHPVRQHFKAAKQDPADEDPDDEHRPGDTDSANHQEQRAARRDRLRRGVGGFLGAALGGAHQCIDFAQEGHGQAAVVLKQVLLTVSQSELLRDEVEPVLLVVALAKTGDDVESALWNPNLLAA